MAEENKKITTRTVDLKYGYEDKETPEKQHRRVVFGKRSTGADFNRAQDNSDGSDVQFAVEMMAAAITVFGELTMPVPLTVLLSLNRIDREKLQSEYFIFLADSSIGDAGKLKDGKIQLAVGIERDGVNYSIVEFGNMLNGYDEIEIEKYDGYWKQSAARIGKEISKIYTANGKSADGNLSLDEIESLDINDFTFLREAEVEWLDSFR